jgi:hypothetical protein
MWGVLFFAHFSHPFFHGSVSSWFRINDEPMMADIE